MKNRQPPQLTPLVAALCDHHARTWQMAIDACTNITSVHWHYNRDTPRLVPARIAYHILMGAERYTWTGRSDDYLPQRQFNKNWLESPLDDLLSLADLLNAMSMMQDRTDRFLRDAPEPQLLSLPSTWPWCGPSLLSQSLYLLRHTQYHVADLNALLRHLNLPTAKWR